MHAVVVKFKARPECAAEFRRLVLAQAANSLANEPACRVFDVSSPPGRECEFLLYELYDDEPAFQAHLKTAHFLRFDRETQAMTTEKIVSAFSLLSPFSPRR